MDMAEILPEWWTRGSDENPTKALATWARRAVIDKNMTESLCYVYGSNGTKNGGAR